VNIPQANPGAFVRVHRQEIDEAIARVLDSGRYILGPEVEAFEREFAAFIDAPHVVAVASGTDALWLSLRTLDLQPGDEVVTVSFTSVATVAAIIASGARPVFVDVCPDDLTMDPSRLSAAINSHTKAILPVHLYGQAARLEEVCAVANEAGVAVIEDCAQAHGATCAGRPVGSWGRLAAFSFYPTKNLGALGDGGAIATADPDLAHRLRLLREYGWRERSVSVVHGWNSRLDELQAAILRVGLRHLASNNARRRAIAAEYDRILHGMNISLPPTFVDRTTVYHQYVVRHQDRDQLRADLVRLRVDTAIHYPIPVHMQEAYRVFGKGPHSLPVTERAATQVLSLPVYPELGPEAVAFISQALRATVPRLHQPSGPRGGRHGGPILTDAR
jgi:dTDP-4-amino-4,6-dideoxygalactose transaminase